MKRYAIVLVLLMLFTPLLLAQPVWRTLEQLSRSEKANAEIEVTLADNASPQAVSMAKQISKFWNNGRFDEALALFPQLAGLTDAREIAIGYRWRMPVLSPQPKWENQDLQVGGRDSIMTTTLMATDFDTTITYDTSAVTDTTYDYDTTSVDPLVIDTVMVVDTTSMVYDTLTTVENYYLAVFLIEGDGIMNRWSVYEATNRKTDTTAFFSDLAWIETYNWVAGYKLNAVGATVAGDHCYVGYSRGLAQNQANIRRFKIKTGQPDNFPDSSSFIEVFSTTSPDSIKEIALASNYDGANDELYYLAATSGGELKCYYDSPACTSFAELSTGIADVDHGLDVAFNANFADLYLWVSYIDQNDSLCVAADSSAGNRGWITLTRYDAGSGLTGSSISAWNDSVTCVYDYYDGSSYHVQYAATYNAGGAWEHGDIDTPARGCDVTARESAGVAVAYNYVADTANGTLAGRYVWRDYQGAWGSPETYSSLTPDYAKPAIEYLGYYEGLGRIYGVIYLTADSLRTAYFDWNTLPGPPVGIPDAADGLPSKLTLMQNYPNPFNPATTIQYALTSPGKVKLEVFDILGRKVATLVNEYQTAGIKQVRWNAADQSSGLYFYQLTAGDYSETRRMLLLK